MWSDTTLYLENVQIRSLNRISNIKPSAEEPLHLIFDGVTVTFRENAVKPLAIVDENAPYLTVTKH